MSTILTGVRWETYESLLCDFQDRSTPRFAYDRGTLEIMSPLSRHEGRKQAFEAFVSFIADERSLDIVSRGSTTFRRADLQRGVEPDGCFYIQSVDQLPADLDDLDPEQMPIPELVVEVDLTHPSLDKLPLYAAIGVREVWLDNGRRVRIFRREETSEGPRFNEAPSSAAFEGVTSEVLTRFVDWSQTLKRTEWVRRLRAWERGEEQQADAAAPPQ